VRACTLIASRLAPTIIQSTRYFVEARNFVGARNFVKAKDFVGTGNFVDMMDDLPT
jgi:hypothetical protein